MKKSSLILIRCVLSVLILCNLALIFNFSSQMGTKSNTISSQVSSSIAQNAMKDFDQKTPYEQKKIVEKLNPIIRKLAHMAEFGMLGLLIFTLLLTWKNFLLLRWALSLTSVFATGCLDELLQSVTDGRNAAFVDVLIDLSGALISCTLLLACILLARHVKYKKERKQQAQ